MCDCVCECIPSQSVSTKAPSPGFGCSLFISPTRAAEDAWRPAEVPHRPADRSDWEMDAQKCESMFGNK